VPEFQIGQLVRHLRYDYRGVIIGVDPQCLADEDWYLHNKTQPPRDQPWYHVLVHGADHTTYVAESNLEPDSSGEEVLHPLVRRIFASFHEGRYHVESLN
jgi:heat shock protein HspQ